MKRKAPIFYVLGVWLFYPMGDESHQTLLLYNCYLVLLALSVGNQRGHRHVASLIHQCIFRPLYGVWHRNQYKLTILWVSGHQPS